RPSRSSTRSWQRWVEAVSRGRSCCRPPLGVIRVLLGGRGGDTCVLRFGLPRTARAGRVAGGRGNGRGVSAGIFRGRDRCDHAGDAGGARRRTVGGSGRRDEVGRLDSARRTRAELAVEDNAGSGTDRTADSRATVALAFRGPSA